MHCYNSHVTTYSTILYSGCYHSTKNVLKLNSSYYYSTARMLQYFMPINRLYIPYSIKL